MRCWDGEYVVYNPLSGNTHVVDILAGEVLQIIRAGSAQTSEVNRRIAEFLEVPDDAETARKVEDILQELDELGLIERVTGC